MKKIILIIITIGSINASADVRTAIPELGQFENNPLNMHIMVNSDSSCDDVDLYLQADMKNLSNVASTARLNLGDTDLGLAQLSSALDMISDKVKECYFDKLSASE